MTDPRPDAPPAPNPGTTLPWHGIGVVCAAAAAGIVAYVGVTGAQLFGMVSAAPDALPVADPPVLATPYVAPTSEPAPRAPRTHAPKPVAKTEPSRSERRPTKPSPSPAATASPAAEKTAPTRAAAPKATRQQTLEVKHATWADRQLASMLRSTPTSAMTWFSGSFVLPTSSYHLTARFGETSYLWSSSHTGLDFAAATGTPVRAVTTGTVTSVGWGGAYGNRIEITHPDGTQTWYCHLSKTYVTTGQPVGTGTVIGAVGATGNVTGPHLHLEVRPNGGSPVDPYAYLQQHGLHP